MSLIKQSLVSMQHVRIDSGGVVLATIDYEGRKLILRLFSTVCTRDWMAAEKMIKDFNDADRDGVRIDEIIKIGGMLVGER